MQPPHLRIVGSHNNKAPLELLYLARLLSDHGHDVEVLNADATDASRYVTWERLFHNSHYLSAAGELGSSLDDETVERIIGREPDVVVLSGGDSCTPWVDLGSPYTASRISRRLRGLGLFTVGVGPFFRLTGEKFLPDFDAIVAGDGPNMGILPAVSERRVGRIWGPRVGRTALPWTPEPLEGSRHDVLMTSLGCPHSCSFCLGRNTGFDYLELGTIEMDLSVRIGPDIDIGDSRAPSAARIDQLWSVLANSGKRFSWEMTVGGASDRSLALLQSCGGVRLRFGIESGSTQTLTLMEKRQSRVEMLSAVRRAQGHGFEVIAYVLLGGPGVPPGSARETLELCEEMGADDYVVNVWSHFDLVRRDFSGDAHFSLSLAALWGVDDILPEFFALMRGIKPGLGRLIDSPRGSSTPSTTGGH